MAADSPQMFIALEQVRLHGFHGVLPKERKVGAEYELSVELSLPATAACSSDNLADTVSYADVFELVNELFGQPCELLEHLVHRIASAIMVRWSTVTDVRVKVTKLAPPIPGFLGHASVALNMSRDNIVEK